MPYPDLVWTTLAAIGGLLLIGDASHLSTKGKWGVWLIFAAFLVQVYWEILHQAEASKLVWNMTSQWQVGYVTFVLVLGVCILICRRLKSRNQRKS